MMFKNILLDVQNGNVGISNYYENKQFKIFLDSLSKTIKTFPTYTFNGRFETLLFDKLKESIKYDCSYQDFVQELKLGFEKLSEPCIIILPLNYLNNSSISSNIYLSKDVALFKTEDIKNRRWICANNKPTELEKYVQGNVNIPLPKEHILVVKDKNFFNFPLLTIIINRIDNQVVIESGTIVEAAYSFIRMLDYNILPDENDMQCLIRCKLAPARTYCVYYNRNFNNKDVGLLENNCYGYSLRFKFSPILDVSTDVVLNQLERFESLLSLFIKCSFLDKSNYDQKSLEKISKWQNAVLLFNTAYEFASLERYDSTTILLLTILESLFIKNEGNKKEQLVVALQDFFSNNNNLLASDIRKTITNAYRDRNKFVHEGIGVENEYKYSKPLGDLQGIVAGMKPFVHIGLNHCPSNISTIKNLFNITTEVILGYNQTLNI